MAERIKGINNAFLLITGFLTCPCHLLFVLPVLAAVLAGTAMGAFISENMGLLIALATVYFLGVAIYFLLGSGGIARGKSSESLDRLGK